MRESKRRLTHDCFQESIGSREVLKGRASLRVAMRTLAFRGVWLAAPSLIHRYNNYLAGAASRPRRTKVRH